MYKTILFARGQNKNNPMFRRDKKELFNSILYTLSIYMGNQLFFKRLTKYIIVCDGSFNKIFNRILLKYFSYALKRKTF